MNEYHCICTVSKLIISRGEWHYPTELPDANLLRTHIGADSSVTALDESFKGERELASSGITIEQTIRYGQTLANLLEQLAVQPGDISRAIAALQEIFDPRDLRAGHALHVVMDSSRALRQLLYRPSPEITVRVEREANGNLTGRCDTLALTPEIFLLTGEVETTLYEAVLASGETPELLLAFTDIFQWDIDFFIDPQPGDRFRILFEKLVIQKPLKGSSGPEDNKEFVRYGRILAASYEPKRPQQSNIGKEIIAAFYFNRENGKEGYFDREGKSFQKTFLKSPLNYRRISSYFSWGRRHPILKKVRAHTGVDFSAPAGTPIVAAAEGTIKEIGWKGGYGKCVVIAHKNHFAPLDKTVLSGSPRWIQLLSGKLSEKEIIQRGKLSEMALSNGVATFYGHLSRFADLKEGDMVQQGQVIGYVGSTGLTTGPHLHYTMYLNGMAINPLKIQPAASDPIPDELLAAFAAQRDALLLQMGMLPDAVYGPPVWISER
jgi:murein DD-endopeptidase MepM/ murein hydrolase activator NlpD